MATCLSTITALLAGPGIGSLTVINPDTNTPLSFSPSSNQLLLASMLLEQVVTFTVSLAPSIPGIYSATLTIYKVTGPTTVTSYASINLNSNLVTFSKDFEAGNYIFCFRATGVASYTGNIIGHFVSIPSSATLFPFVKVGEKVTAVLTVPIPTHVCSQQMFYEMTAGELPPGITLDSLGNLVGTLPNLDCVGPDQYGYDYSPSFNWFYARGDYAQPIGRQWRFRVKLYLAANPSVFKEEWFCIRIYNNWDFDRDNFVAQEPFDHTTTVIVADPPPKLEPICEDCPDPTPPKFEAKPIPELCVPCDTPELSQVTLIKIPLALQELPPSQFALWYAQNRYVDYSVISPEIETFIKALESSQLFSKLLEQNGLAPSHDPTPQELLIATTYQNFLQIASKNLNSGGRNPTDIDQQLLGWQLQENQANPIFVDASHGEYIPPFELFVPLL